MIPSDSYRIPELEEYIRQDESSKRERAMLWRTAIGLQQVDGLRVSDYLIETAKQHVEGDITIKKAKSLIDSYYQSEHWLQSIDTFFMVYISLPVKFATTTSPRRNGYYEAIRYIMPVRI